MRKIIHIDADCFFAAIEMRDNPELLGRPMAVGGRSDRRGVIATCNYEARAFGVRSAMASGHALKLCPSLIIVPPRMEAYREASLVMKAIFHEFTDAVEPLSLDEAYLDVSSADAFEGSATRIAEEIRQRIFDALKITVSAGVSNSKFLSKVASDWNKPNGVCVVRPEQVDEFVKALSVNKIHGVGRVTGKKLNDLGIFTCADLRDWSVDALSARFGRFGGRLHQLAHGVDDREVKATRVRKSLSVERTCVADLQGVDACLELVPSLLNDLNTRLGQLKQTNTIIKAFVKVKFSDFTSTTLERTGVSPQCDAFLELMREAVARKPLGVRLLGLGVRFATDKSPAEQGEGTLVAELAGQYSVPRGMRSAVAAHTHEQLLLFDDSRLTSE